MTTSVHDVIALFLLHARGHLSVSTIHKLCYYAQGYSLAWQNAPLFPEEIQLRSTGPVVPTLYPFHKDNPYTAASWPAGNTARVNGPDAKIIKSVFDSYGHLTGLIMGRNAAQEAPCIRAAAKATEETPHPVIDLDDLKAFFKAYDDAPADRVDYANRFISNYMA